MRVIIIGAGLTGLIAAENIRQKAEVLIFEKNSSAGGLARTEIAGDFKFDYTGHFLHFNNERIKKKVQDLFEEKSLLEINRKSFIYIDKSFVPYPFQSHIYYLPQDLKKECLIGFLENLKGGFAGEPRPGADEQDENFYNWMKKQYGKGIVKYFMLPYNEKMWTVHPEDITTEWMKRFVPMPSPEEILLGTITKGKDIQGYNATFYYPESGIGELIRKFQGFDNMHLKSKVEKVNFKDKTVYVKGKKYPYDFLISTCPLKEFIINMLEPEDDKVLNYADKLRCNSVLNINIGWKGQPCKSVPRATHWIYFPEKKFDFYRVGFPPAVSGMMCPEGHYSCYVEISYIEGKLPERNEYKKIEKVVISQLESAGIIPARAEIVQTLILPMKTAYVIYDENRKNLRNYTLNYLEDRGIFSGGRYGGWEYSTMEDAVIWGEKLSQKVLNKLK